MGRVIVVGSLNVDLVTSVESHPRPGETVLGSGLDRYAGGKGANQAAAAARAGSGEVLMVGRVGADEGGTLYRERLGRAGVDVSGVLVDPDEPTGHALIVVSETGENTIVVIPGANGRVRRDDLGVLTECGPGDVVLLQLEIPLPVVSAAVRLAHERGARVVVNAAPFAALEPDVVALAEAAMAGSILRW